MATREKASVTYKEVKAALRALDIIILISVPGINREYRVNYWRGKEETAYYTNDLDDALHTGEMMGQAEAAGVYAHGYTSIRGE